MDKWEFQARTKAYALRVMTLADALPSSRSGNVIANQIVRSGTSVGANYRSACRARSHADFVSKLGIAEEEADETLYWLELVIEGGHLQASKVRPLYDEGEQVLKMLAASRRSAVTRSRTNRKSEIGNRK